jgi:hypothetical protein
MTFRALSLFILVIVLITGRKVSSQYYIKHWLSITASANADGASEIFLNPMAYRMGPFLIAKS